MPRFASITCWSFLLLSQAVIALTCPPTVVSQIVEQNDTIFVARITGGQFVPGESRGQCGWIDASFEVAEELKGEAASVKSLRKALTRCGGVRRFSGVTDKFPFGRYVLVATNGPDAGIGFCGAVWEDYEPSCLVDEIRTALEIDPPNAEYHEWCKQDRASKGDLSYQKALKQHLENLKWERDFINIEIEDIESSINKQEANLTPK